MRNQAHRPVTVPNLLGTPVDPRNEVLVYERGYFADASAQVAARPLLPAYRVHAKG